MRRTIQALVGATTLVATLALANTAHAGLSDCGNIHVEASAQCEMSGGIECEARCEPLQLEASCAAQLHATCEGMCNATFDAMCAADCSASCVGECEVDPGKFDCSASCQGDCEGSCMAMCDGSECAASCTASCSAECDASCDIQAPQADCDAHCNASCEGSCTVEANAQCQIDCQATGYVDCKAELQGGCEAECNTEDGALFCDGQYVDHGGNLKGCVDALRELFDIEVEGYASGECSNGKCEGEAGGSISCSGTIDTRRDDVAPLALLGMGLLGLRRRRLS